MPVGMNTEGSIGTILGNAVTGWQTVITTNIDKAATAPDTPYFDHTDGSLVIPHLECQTTVTAYAADGRLLYRTSGHQATTIKVQPECPRVLLIILDSPTGRTHYRVGVK